ncbi:unnamed protein product [Trichogramma brassicae]|uniref:DNA helicase n=1 Tax=Trichogramma brassicae TaxID=86971 RepID=A0A6H5J1Q3_9HYME|nr:unnamed protein product [Trichogramma brassicae]
MGHIPERLVYRTTTRTPLVYTPSPNRILHSRKSLLMGRSWPNAHERWTRSYQAHSALCITNSQNFIFICRCSSRCSIARVHPVVSLYRINGSQFAYHGNDESLQHFQSKHKNLKFVIIDEMSMVGARMLHQIERRCTIQSGECSSELSMRKPGCLNHARWLTCANRILRLYVSTADPSSSLLFNPKITKLPDEFFSRARSATWCTRSTECDLTPSTRSVQSKNNKTPRGIFFWGQIGDLVPQVDGM